MSVVEKHGFTLVEVLAGTLLLSLVGLVVMMPSFRLNAMANQAMDNSSTKAELLRLSRLIVKIGRLATGCAKLVLPDIGLQCLIDFDDPPVGNLVTVRFLFDANGNKILYRRRNPDLTWTDVRYLNARSFEVCDTADFVAGSCGLQPIGLSQASAIVTPNAFFRFRITPMKVRSEQDQTMHPIQGAFFTRQQATGAWNGMKYVW